MYPELVILSKLPAYAYNANTPPFVCPGAPVGPDGPVKPIGPVGPGYPIIPVDPDTPPFDIVCGLHAYGTGKGPSALFVVSISASISLYFRKAVRSLDDIYLACIIDCPKRITQNNQILYVTLNCT